MQASALQWIGATLFAIAVLHTFSIKSLHRWSRRFSSGSAKKNLLLILSEVEIVFGLWAAVLLLVTATIEGPHNAITYLESRNFNEPIFVFAILAICATKPVFDLAKALISGVSKLLPFKGPIALYLSTLTIGPLLGSLITEPAAMTVSALLLLDSFYRRGISARLKYATLGVLFVNISIGGTLTPFAAPPVLMVADQWGWGMKTMFLTLGWKGALSCVLSSGFVAFRFRDEIVGIGTDHKRDSRATPVWIRAFHLLFLVAIVASAHHPALVVGFFLFFLGFVGVTNQHQEPIRLREGLLVSFFLAGLVVIGGVQDWWLKPILSRLSALPLYLGTMGLTAVTDNAALTYLGSLVPTLTDASRYSLVAGAVVGGGLTVIANAPNPAGYSILQPAFGEDGISSLDLLRAALIPTFIAATCFWFL